MLLSQEGSRAQVSMDAALLQSLQSGLPHPYRAGGAAGLAVLQPGAADGQEGQHQGVGDRTGTGATTSGELLPPAEDRRRDRLLTGQDWQLLTCVGQQSSSWRSSMPHHVTRGTELQELFWRLQVVLWTRCQCPLSARALRQRGAELRRPTGADIAADALAEEQVAHAAQRFFARAPKPG